MPAPAPIDFRISAVASRGIDRPKLDATWAPARQLGPSALAAEVARAVREAWD